LILVGLLVTELCAAATPRRPNVIFILTDDQGAWALRGQGATELKTPHLDRLMQEGTSFPNAFVATPVCSPSRMTYLTGKMPSSHGLQFHLSDSGAPKSSRLEGQGSFTEILAKNGYVVGLSGKWHLGGDLQPHAGFSYWRVLHGVRYRDPLVVISGERQEVPGFKTDLEANYAIEFIEQNRDRPFFLYWAANAPHRDYDYQPAEDREPYLQSRFPSFPREPMHPWQNPNPQLAGDHGNQESMISYAALVTGLDRNVGRLLQRLEELKLLENTVIVFSSDNGYNTGHHGVWGKGSGTVPFNLYEESVRVPLIWWHPGRIPATARVQAHVSNYDLFPTLLDYLELSAPEDPKRVGHSYAPFLRGSTIDWSDTVYFEYAYMRGIRTASMKYIERTSDWLSELYDLDQDPQERHNLWNDPERSKQRAELKKKMELFFDGVGSPPLEEWATTTTQKHPPYSTERLPWYPAHQSRR
ncbi:MAG TPA: sulfatase-like hydrolase/transferase, partial [Opitutaceae bacterium]|nr:sulfatase-like hydrolase/transferase [Opitutaceae bacterium]